MVKNNSNSDKFEAIYNELDRYMRTNLDKDEWVSHSSLIDGMVKVKGNSIFKQYKDDLKYYANLRNSIVHNPYKRVLDPIAEPHEYIVKKYEEIKNKVISPPLALESIAIKANDIYTASMEDKVLEVMRKMNENVFTHVPVLDDDGKVIGVFSENTIFSYLAKNEFAITDKDILIKEFKDLINIDKNESECYEFVARDKFVIDIEEIFQVGLQYKKRIAVVFITHNGNENEKLLGLITAWDLAGYVG